MVAMAQQEPRQLLAGLPQAAHRRQACPHEIADRFVGLIRNPDRRQRAGAVQPCQVDRIPPVGLDPVAGLERDQRWRDHDALVPGHAQLTLDAIAAQTRLIAKLQAASATSQPAHQLRQSCCGVGDLAVLAHFSPLALVCNRHSDGVFVDVKAHVGAKLVHDPSSYA